MSVVKKITISILAILTIVCVALDVWWAYVYFAGDNKLVVKTYEVDLQTLTDGTKQPLVEVQLFRNVDGSGLSAFEIRWNYIMDETRTSFYSQGTQFIGDDFNSSWYKELFYEGKTYGTFFKTKHEFYTMRLCFDNIEQYNYMSGNEYYDTLNDTNPLGDDTFVV